MLLHNINISLRNLRFGQLTSSQSYVNFYVHFVTRFYHKTEIYCKDILLCKKKQLEKICLLDKDIVDPCKPSPKVLIIGAGMAGLSAASRLMKAGITDVTVLEATERPGGRIHSCWLANTVAEIGAQWIFGSSICNTTLTLAAQEGLIDSTCLVKHINGLDPGVIYMTSDGKNINKSLAVKAYLMFKQIEQKAYGLYQLSCGREHGSLMNYLTLAIEQELQNFDKSQRDSASKVMYGQTNFLKNRWGAELDKISADLLGTFVSTSGDCVGIPLGFVGIIAPLMRDVPKSKLLYKKVVNGIRWSKVCNEDGTPAARVRVTCCDGSSYCGDYVVVTTSLGVLKANAEKIFAPKLPAEKLDAIKKLGYGNTSKIFLEYVRPFWVWKEGTINLAWSTEELKKKDEWVTGISTIEEVAGSRQILMATVAGDQASRVEELADQKVAEDMTAVLRKFTGDPSLPYPNSVLRSKWKASPYFAGTNSFMATTSTVGHQCDLAASVPIVQPIPGRDAPPPIAPILFFAGEATCPSFYSTVHGARLSGLRVAKDIIELTRLYGGPPPLPGEDVKDFDPC